jgi:hypothetical protein
MGGYRSEDEALIGLARQLADAYGEARTIEDQDFACEAIAEFLAEYRSMAPSAALLAILGLPLTAETYPLVDEVQTTLADRGPAAVRVLLGAAQGEVYDPDGPAPERAAETLDLMDRRDVVKGMVDVLCSRAGGDVKGAAVDGLVATGAFAEPALAAALDDGEGGDWAQAALEQIRYHAAVRPEGLEEYAAGEGTVPDDAGSLLESDGTKDERPAAGDGHSGETDRANIARDAPEQGADAPGAGSVDESSAVNEADPAAADGPDKQTVDDAFEEFLRRYHQESDEGPSAS